MIDLMNSRDGFTGPCNIGNPNEFTMLELAEKVIAGTNSKSQIIHLDMPQDDPKQRQPIIDLAKKELNWSPTIELEQGLEKTIELYPDPKESDKNISTDTESLKKIRNAGMMH